jgi:hypothetical protein
MGDSTLALVKLLRVPCRHETRSSKKYNKIAMAGASKYKVKINN